MKRGSNHLLCPQHENRKKMNSLKMVDQVIMIGRTTIVLSNRGLDLNLEIGRVEIQ